jgi:hypothetical protein
MADKKEVNVGGDNGEKRAYAGSQDLSSLESRSERSPNAGEAFDTAGLDDLYKPIPTYEGIHRYDPKFQWTPEEETKVKRRVCIASYRTMNLRNLTKH